MDNVIFWGNGMILKENSKRAYANAHLYYKGYSIIVDYEKTLHAYQDCVYEDKTIVPFELYPYDGGIYVGYLTLNNDFHKIDISNLMSEIDKINK